MLGLEGHLHNEIEQGTTAALKGVITYHFLPQSRQPMRKRRVNRGDGCVQSWPTWLLHLRASVSLHQQYSVMMSFKPEYRLTLSFSLRMERSSAVGTESGQHMRPE